MRDKASKDRPRLGWLTGLIVVGAMLVAPAAEAKPKLGANDLSKIKVVNSAIPLGQGQVAGTTSSCPKGGRVIAGGVFFTPGIDQAPVATDVTRVRASVPATDGKSWYGAGENQTGGTRTMYVTAQCLLKSKKRSKKIGANDLAKYDPSQGSIGISPNETTGREATCDDGRVIAGGAFLSNGSAFPNADDNFVLSQLATYGNADVVLGAGRSLVSGNPQVTVRALCLPDTPRSSKKVGSDDLKEFDVKLASVTLLNNQTGGTYALCDDGDRIFSGGLFLQTVQGASVPISENAAISGNSAAGGGNAWYGSARNLSGTTRNATVLALCLPR